MTKLQAGRNEAETAKLAASAAFNFLQKLVPEASLEQAVLEEIESSPDDKHWLVTLSFEEPREHNRHLPEFLRVPRQKFKVFKVSKATGRVLSMRMREG